MCDESFNGDVTAAASVEHRTTRSPSPGPAVWHPTTTHHPETVSRMMHHSRSAPSPTTNDDRLWTALSSEDADVHAVDPGDVDCRSSMSVSSSDAPTDFRPGGLSKIETLQRIFPLHRRNVLDLVLAGCNGDLVKAIERFLSVQDTFSAQHGHRQHHHPQRHQQNVSSYGHGRSETRDGLPVSATAGQDVIGGSSTLALDSMRVQALARSAFQPSPGFRLYSSFPLRAAAFTTDSLLARGIPPPLGTAGASAPSRLLSPHPPLRFDDWLAPSVRAGFPSPTVFSPFLFGHHPHRLRIPLPMLHRFQAPPLADRSVQMMAAAAAAVTEQVPPSHTLADTSAGIRPAVASSGGGSSGRIRGTTANVDHNGTSECQALDLHCRSDVSISP